MNTEQKTMTLWHKYAELGGRADFETFYGHKLDNQKLLVKVREGWQKC